MRIIYRELTAFIITHCFCMCRSSELQWWATQKSPRTPSVCWAATQRSSRSCAESHGTCDWTNRAGCWWWARSTGRERCWQGSQPCRPTRKPTAARASSRSRSAARGTSVRVTVSPARRTRCTPAASPESPPGRRPPRRRPLERAAERAPAASAGGSSSAQRRDCARGIETAACCTATARARHCKQCSQIWSLWPANETSTSISVSRIRLSVSSYELNLMLWAIHYSENTWSEGAYEATGLRVESALSLGVVDAGNEREAAHRARLVRRLHAHENALARTCKCEQPTLVQSVMNGDVSRPATDSDALITKRQEFSACETVAAATRGPRVGHTCRVGVVTAIQVHVHVQDASEPQKQTLTRLELVLTSHHIRASTNSFVRAAAALCTRMRALRNGQCDTNAAC